MKKLILILTLLLVSGYWFLVTSSYADIPHLIGYQGRLTDQAGIPIEGSRSITFRVYDASAGGNLLWQETHPNVTFVNGIFDVLLGSITALNLPFDKQYYLAIQVGSDPEMTPRQQIASVGYAYKAEDATNSDTIDGIHASAIPEANKLVALDANAKLPLSTLKVYDSGWFAVSAANSYTKIHELGTTKVVAQVWVSDQPDGTGAILMTDFDAWPGAGIFGCWLRNLTSTQITLTTADSRITTYGVWTSGYARIIMLALE